ncbi:hypothetical protein NC651_004258 [Populus alba x Populus x berolinensis]|nr:hypothetical protein NC651_004258 [Populus alba x Populus x berolinensis]
MAMVTEACLIATASPSVSVILRLL